MASNLLPQEFDGKANFDEWLYKYELISKANGWGDEIMANNVAIFLSGRAMDCYRKISEEYKQSFEALKPILRSKIITGESQEIAKSQFNQRRQTQFETLEELGHILKELCKVAYPDTDEGVQDMLCKDRYIEALNDKEVRMWVRNMRPKTLEEAILQATIYDNNKKAEALRSSQR